LLLSARAHAKWNDTGLKGAAFEPVWEPSTPDIEGWLVKRDELTSLLNSTPGTDRIAPLATWA
jgi:hypothetical protein